MTMSPVLYQHPFDEILPEERITEPPFFLDGNQGEPLHERAGKEPNPSAARHAMPIVEADPLDAAARRVLLEDIAGQVQSLQIRKAAGRHRLDRLGLIPSGLDRQQPGMPGVADQSHGFTGSAESRFDLRTDRNPFDVAAQQVGEKTIPFVAPVEADFITEQTTADSQQKGGRRHLATCCLPNVRYSWRACP